MLRMHKESLYIYVAHSYTKMVSALHSVAAFRKIADASMRYHMRLELCRCGCIKLETTRHATKCHSILHIT